MLGWCISVYKQANGGAQPASKKEDGDYRIAIWQTGPWGLGWLKDLAAQGKAVCVSEGGYPNRYTAHAEHLLPTILNGPPDAKETWILPEESVGTDLSLWIGRTVCDYDTARKCRFDEWLLVDAWDES